MRMFNSRQSMTDKCILVGKIAYLKYFDFPKPYTWLT